MKNYFVVSAVGRDRPGFVNEMAHAIRTEGGNIELQRSVRMAGEYAALFLVRLSGEPGDAGGVEAKLRERSAGDVSITVRDALAREGAAAPGARPFELIASGADEPGIIDAVTRVLFERQVNIESMDYDTEGAPMSGDPLFRMQAVVSLPPELPEQDLRDRFRALEDSLNLDILFRPAGS